MGRWEIPGIEIPAKGCGHEVRLRGLGNAAVRFVVLVEASNWCGVSMELSPFPLYTLELQRGMERKGVGGWGLR